MVSAQTPAKVLLLPFKIHSGKDLSFLNRGVSAMIASRLAASGRVSVVQDASAAQAVLDAPDGTEVQVALEQAAALQARYAVIGSLTIFGSSVSTDAKFIGVTEQRPLVAFSQVGNNTGDVLSHIHQFAAQVNADVFGMAVAAPRPSYGPVVSGAPVAPAPVVSRPATATPAPAAQVAAPAQETWKSGRFQEEMRSLAAGDIDGDGKTEIATLSGHDITIRRYAAERLETIGQFQGKEYNTLLGIDVADLNGNGRAEIFVTRLTKQGKLDSFVLEWKDGSLRTVADGLNWYFRVVQDSEKGAILVGQKRGIVGQGSAFQIEGADRLFMAGIFELNWVGRSLEAGRRIDLPRHDRVYGFTTARITDGKTPEFAVVTDNDRLRLLDKSGRKKWTSNTRYPGSGTYMEYRIAPDQSQPDRYYLPQRILAADLDGDGKEELILVRNKDIARGFLNRFRHFDSGRVECLSWDKVTMKTLWETEEVSGYVGDAAIADIDGNGTADLVYAAVQSEGSMLDLDFSKAASYLAVRWNIGK